MTRRAADPNGVSARGQFAELSNYARANVGISSHRRPSSSRPFAGFDRFLPPGPCTPHCVLEQAGLVTTEKVGRVRACKLGPRRLEEAAWIERHRQLRSARFDALDEIVEHLKRKEKANARSKRR